MSSKDRPASLVMTLNTSVARGVNHWMCILRSTNSVAMSVDAIRFCRSSLILAVSSTLALSSAFTVISSSFTDCNSSLPVSSSSVAERSSSLMACSSSLDAFSSSVDVCDCSMVVCNWSFVPCSSASNCVITAEAPTVGATPSGLITSSTSSNSTNM
ncbi:hypothetical protein D3C72_1208280 [compost metagenome]